ncbi:MAG: hypothetical protein JW958_13495, partial [Candidatus Eisenbacteria bacterium]|nr:hypothetical protein [Candidatus Eisenbacteria bacterium]
GTMSFATLETDGNLFVGGSISSGDSNPLSVNDDLTVEGDVRFDDGSSLSSLWDSQLSINSSIATSLSSYQEAISNLQQFVNCVGTLATETTYVWSSDYIDCFNSWIAGTPVISAASQAQGAGIQSENMSRSESTHVQTERSSQPITSGESFEAL